MSNPYERYVLPYLTDYVCGARPISRQRAKLVPLAQGRVLEIGIGTGQNLAHYDKSKVKQLVGLDPSMQMHSLARRRMAAAGLEVELLGLSAEKIPQDDASFDTVVVTYTLCTIPDPVSALREMRRVLKPNGQLLFCEHGRAPDAEVARWQDRLNPYWGVIGGGCNLNRDIPAMLRASGWHCPDIQTMYLPGPRWLNYNYWGRATRNRA